jgi:Tol biopolymer transport system component/predicted Ser/Thr protein kinase
MIGRTIAHYKILEKLGEGGMGVVYKALDTKLERFVALKFLPHEISLSADDKARFLQEARAASAVSHANVCVIHDIADHDGQQFIVMEYVDGKTLRQMVPIGKVQDALSYAIQVGEALEAAHSKGVVHRDIKAENIMVNVTNQVKVMDFGLAKLRGSLKLTKTSSTVGTLAYMAPEQIQGGEVDARSDIFSFGVVLYEMLAGQLPFAGEHEAAMMYSILNESPQPIQKFMPELSSELLHIINRALEKDPEDRYQTVREMVIDLRRAKKETSRVSRPGLTPLTVGPGRSFVPEEHRLPAGEALAGERGVGAGPGTPAEYGASAEQGIVTTRAEKVPSAGKRRPIRRAFLLVALAGVLVVLTAIAVFVVRPMRAPGLNPKMSFRTLGVPFAEMGYTGLSRDGSWLAFSACDAEHEWSIYFMNVAGGAPRRLVNEHFEGFNYAEISPDGSKVMFDANLAGKPRSVYVVSSLGGTSRKVVEPGCAGRWRPDGELIGYIRGTRIVPSQSGKREFWTVRPDGSENRLEFADSLSYTYQTFCFDWSPDGKSIAWLRSLPGYNEILIHDLKTGRERQLTAYKSPIDEVAWATNNQIFFTSSRAGNTNIWMIPAKGGEAVQVTKGTGPVFGVRVSADGKRLAYLERRMIHHLWTADIDGRHARQLTFENQTLGPPSFSPDKKHISFLMFSADPMSPTSNVFVMEGDGTNRTQLTSAEAYYNDAMWSPDGKYIAYTSCRIGEPYDSTRVYLVDVSNPGTPRLIGKGIVVLWISAEELIALTGPSHSHSTIYSIHKTEPLEVSQDSTSQIPLPDGKHILFWDMRKGHEGWWLKTRGMEQSAPTRQIVPLENYTYSFPTASLRYLLSNQANGEMWLISLPDGKRVRLPEIFDHLNPYNLDIRLSYDDKQAVYLKGQLDSRLVLIENLFK